MSTVIEARIEGGIEGEIEGEIEIGIEDKGEGKGRSGSEAAGRRSVRRAALFALAAVLVRGGWAFAVNLPLGMRPALRALLVQVAWSFVASFSMSLLQQWLFGLCRSTARGALLAAVGATVVGVGAGALVHVVSGTPRVLITVAPAAVLAVVTFTASALALRAAEDARRARG